jgi:hypothetical protein
MTRRSLALLAVLGVIGVALTGTATTAAATSRVVVTGHADVRVWLDDTRDVYADYNDVVLSLHATRDCYATVFIIDTDGYVHIVRPLSPWDSAWIRGGHTYRYSGHELGLAWMPGRGIAHVFAVSSPYPFDYSPYGEAIFAGGFGFRVYGDPFIACREIYLSLLPAGCGMDLVSVSVARFYIREWVRYPGYLCRGHDGFHVRVGDYCRRCAHIYDGYRAHLADPLVIIRSRARTSGYAEVKRSTVKYKSRERREAVAGWSREGARSTRSVRGDNARPSRSGHKVVSRKTTPLTRRVATVERRATTNKRVVSSKRVVSRKATVSKVTRATRKTTKGVQRSTRTRRKSR